MPAGSVAKSAVERLFALDDAFACGEAAERLFLDAVAEVAAFHYGRSDVYRAICKERGFRPGPLADARALEELPFIFVDAFKEHTLLSVPQREIVFTFSSSGTGGMQSRIMWDEASMARQGVMRARTMATLGLVSDSPARYAIFSYDYAQSRGKGAAYAHEMYSTFAPAIEKYYALRIRASGGDFAFDLDEAAGALEAMAERGDPVRILGFPSFAWFTVRKLQERRKTLPLHPESLVVNGGGWKLHTGEDIGRDRYRDALSRFFGIEKSRIRDVFGMVEHGVPYISCPHGNFHEPVYAKILVRHPLTGAVLPAGEVGLIQLITPYIRSMPTFSLLSSDLGLLGEGCPCGIEKPFFTVLRRGGTRVYKGCALAASELLR